MPQIIRVKRNVTSAAGPTTLDPGELGYTGFGGAHNLYVGDATTTVQNLVNPLRQVEIAGAQTITGVKTFDDVAKLNVIPPAATAVGSVLQLANAGTGALAFGPAVAAAQLYIGSLDATAGTIAFTTASGLPGPGLPAAAPANSGWYIICNVAGSTVPANVPAGAYTQGDWVLSNATAWNHLDFGGTSVTTASDVGVVAPLTGGDVQVELEDLQLNKVAKAGDVMTGLLQLSGNPTAALHAAPRQYVDPKITGPATSTLGGIATYADTTGRLAADSGILAADLATITYVDTENAAQDVIITANAAFIALQPGVDTAQDTVINNKITKPATVAAVGNIATYANVAGDTALDGGVTVAQLQAAIAAKGDVTGPTGAPANNIAVFSGITGKVIADGGIPIPASFGDVTGPGAAGNLNIAVFSGVTGKVIADGGVPIPASFGDVVGPNLSGDLNVALFSGTTGKLIADSGRALPATFGDVVGPAGATNNNVATFDLGTGKLIKDSGVLATSLLTTVAVAAPHLTGNGLVATPITFAGIAIAANSTTSFTGVGTSVSALDLVLVDGGTYP